MPLHVRLRAVYFISSSWDDIIKSFGPTELCNSILYEANTTAAY